MSTEYHPHSPHHHSGQPSAAGQGGAMTALSGGRGRGGQGRRVPGGTGLWLPAVSHKPDEVLAVRAGHRRLQLVLRLLLQEPRSEKWQQASSCISSWLPWGLGSRLGGIKEADWVGLRKQNGRGLGSKLGRVQAVDWVGLRL